ncbi:nucleotide sugar dehydrogenase [Paenibacillus glycanilyticus]|uniref:UDP-N-acetyl-D-glucosamine dehydrogenase n=1 Tax=Paenibacillus glycanilyticus TaxID=126569 RepID=A0ABQ6GM78_9BACL|nr:nucleotide sugar dehydrogenase [Paenibacillus glycanilyticus]GLX71378.1 UDP-N-acetyl-D-glucosamine dehydrogenase [Paenibacillus glycanilyticus]
MKEDHNFEVLHRKVAIIGLGFVGLPLSMMFIRKGFHVVGIDYDSGKISAIQQGKSYIQDLSDTDLADAMQSGRWQVSADYAALAGADTVIICVPTPLSPDNSPNLSYLTDTCARLSPLLTPGQLVVVESSTYPGTTREVVLPLLEKSGLAIGQQLYIGYSPERIDPGNTSIAFTAIPKIISGITTACEQKLNELYSQVFEHVITVSSTETAETAKLLENSYRFVNISFINEFAQLCDRLNINVWEVIQASATKPYGYSAFYPGPGIGGHCIPVDPLYLQWKAAEAGTTSRFIELSQQVNDSMPNYLADRIEQELQGGKKLTAARILVYGVTYKPNIADVRESAALPLIHTLLQRGAIVDFHDPYVQQIKLDKDTILLGVELTDERLEQADCVLVCTNHDVMPIERLIKHSSFIFDTRNAVSPALANRAGTKLVILGDGKATS